MSRDKPTEFDSQDPFQNLALRNKGLLPPPPIVRIEGWQNYVNRETTLKPVMPSEKYFLAMPDKEKREIAKQRKKYHSDMPLMETPTLTKIHGEAMRLATLNYSAPPGARMGLILDGLGTVGKSTIAMELGKKYELSWRKNILPKIQCVGINRPIPVIYVTLSGELTIRDFNRLIISFMGISAPASARVPWLNDKIIDATQSCGTSLIIVDDIHYLQMRNRTAMAVNNHLKFLANCISATFVYAGIHVEGTGLLLEGKSNANAFASQTQHRFKTYQILPFSKESLTLKPLLSSFETHLALMRQPLGFLENLSDYIHDRTGGFMGAISNLVREGANVAIQNGSEKLTRATLEEVNLDFASEAFRKTTTSRGVVSRPDFKGM